MLLSGRKKGVAGILIVQISPNGNPVVCLATRPKDGRNSGSCRSASQFRWIRQKELRLTVRVVFEQHDVLVADKERVFAIVPMSRSNLYYSTRRIR